MVKGVDFGGIHINKTCQNKYSCKIESHFSKPSLFKPGSEKFCSLFHLKLRFAKDNETWEMSGNQKGLYCYTCKLYDKNGLFVGEGRGVSDINEKRGWTVNNAVKIAQKRAQVDAILRTGSLSDFFTQDIEDASQRGEGNQVGQTSQSTPKAPQAQNNNGSVPFEGKPEWQNKEPKPIAQDQALEMAELFAKLRIVDSREAKAWLEEFVDIKGKTARELTFVEASKILIELRKQTEPTKVGEVENIPTIPYDEPTKPQDTGEHKGEDKTEFQEKFDNFKDKHGIDDKKLKDQKELDAEAQKVADAFGGEVVE